MRRKSTSSIACLLTQEKRLLKELDTLQIEVVPPWNQNYLVALQVTSPLIEQIKQNHKEDPKIMKIGKGLEEGRIKEFQVQNNVLRYGNKLCVPNVLDLKKQLLKEAHNSALTTHPGSTKMYHDLKMYF